MPLVVFEVETAIAAPYAPKESTPYIDYGENEKNISARAYRKEEDH
jgi:hypothetical protein